MRTFGCSLALALFTLLLPGGCPTAGLIPTSEFDAVGRTDTGFNSTGAPTTTAGGSAIGGNATATGGGTASDDLTARFPACGDPLNAASWKAEVLRLVNRERSNRGLPTLSRSDTLENQAEQYACEMIQDDFFAHVNPVTGSTLAQRAGEFRYNYYVIGENLAAGQTSPEQVVLDWMNSPGHRANILDERFIEIGIAVRAGGTYGLYWVQEFGLPQNTGTKP